MESRKIQTVSGGTFTVSLPQDWAESEGLEQGTVVDIFTHVDGTLSIQTRGDGSDLTDRTVVAAPDRGDALERLLRASYVEGYDEVTLTAEDGFSETQRAVVDEIARTFAGVTVASESETRMTVGFPLDPEEISVRQIVRQLKFVVLSMHRDVMAGLPGDGHAAPSSDRDDHADRLYAMVDRSFERALSRLDEIDALGLTRQELFDLWEVARELERVADHAERIGRITADIDTPTREAYTDDLSDIAESAGQVVDDAVGGALGDAGKEAIQRALTNRDQVRERAAALDRRLYDGSSVDYRFVRILDSVRRTAEHGGNIAERAVQIAVRNGEETPEGTGDDLAIHRDHSSFN